MGDGVGVTSPVPCWLMMRVSRTPSEVAMICAEREAPKFWLTETETEVLDVSFPLLRSSSIHEAASSGVTVSVQSEAARSLM